MFHKTPHPPSSIQPQSILVRLPCRWKVLVPSSPDPSLSHVRPGLLNVPLHNSVQVVDMLLELAFCNGGQHLLPDWCLPQLISNHS